MIMDHAIFHSWGCFLRLLYQPKSKKKKDKVSLLYQTFIIKNIFASLLHTQ